MMSSKAASEPNLTVQIGLDPIDIQGLEGASLDVQEAIKTLIPKPASVSLERILELSSELPQVYQTNFAIPIIDLLKMPRDILEYPLEKLQEDTSSCLIEFCEPQNDSNTSAVQRMVHNLFFRVKKSQSELPTLFTWSHGSKGIYVWNTKFLETFEIKASIVTMPQVHAKRGGILAWTALAYEVSSHYLLKAHPQLIQELEKAIAATSELPFADYWKKRGLQLVTDTLGVLNLGPAGAIGLIGYLRALNPNGLLSEDEGPSHSLPDLVRALLVAHIIENLRLTNAKNWSKEIQKEILKQYPQNTSSHEYEDIAIGENQGSFAQVTEAVKILAAILCHTKLECLGGKSLIKVRSWDDDDEVLVQKLRETIRKLDVFRQSYVTEHIISAITLESVKKEKATVDLFKMMVGLLEKIHSFESPHVS